MMFLTRHRRFAAACMLAASLAACTTVPTTPSAPATSAASSAYERSGRFALTVRDMAMERTRDSVQGGFTWVDTGSLLTLDLNNPLGSTLARVVVSDSQAVLTRANGERIAAADPDSLVAEVLGSPIPVSGMRHWLRGQRDGRPVAAGSQQFDEAGWHVRMSDFDAKGPTRLQFDRRLQGEQVTVRVVTERE